MPTSDGISVKTVNADGSVSVSGRPLLKASQAYPPDFGTGMAALYVRHQQTLREEAANGMAAHMAGAPRTFASKLDLLAPKSDVDMWVDARLLAVFELLQSMVVDQSLA